MPVARVGSWSSVNATTLTHSNGAGKNRVMIAVIGSESNLTHIVSSVDYGGQAMTKVAEIEVGTSVFALISIWYLEERGIVAASTTTVTPTWDQGPNEFQNIIAAGTFEGVNQTSPIAQFNTDSDTSSIPLTNMDLVESIGNAIIAGATSGSPGTTTWNSPMSETADGSPSSCTMSAADRLSITDANVDIEPTFTAQNRAAGASIELAAIKEPPHIIMCKCMIPFFANLCASNTILEIQEFSN